MSKFPYSPRPSNIKEFLNKIQKIKIPDKVDNKYIKSIGFTSSNDRYIPGILNKLGFIDNSNKPLPRWKEYISIKQSPKIMAQAIYDAYSDLFNIYQNAFNENDETLMHFFSTYNNVAEGTRKHMVNTFKILCGLADFEAPSIEAEIETVEKVVSKVEIPSTTGLTINVNIQFTLPGTHDISIYDKIFESLKKNILSK